LGEPFLAHRAVRQGAVPDLPTVGPVFEPRDDLAIFPVRSLANRPIPSGADMRHPEPNSSTALGGTE